MEIVDIECVLLSFLSEKFVSTQWRIDKGSANCFSTAKFAKKIKISRLKMEKKVLQRRESV